MHDPGKRVHELYRFVEVLELVALGDSLSVGSERPTGQLGEVAGDRGDGQGRSAGRQLSAMLLEELSHAPSMRSICSGFNQLGGAGGSSVSSNKRGSLSA